MRFISRQSSTLRLVPGGRSSRGLATRGSRRHRPQSRIRFREWKFVILIGLTIGWSGDKPLRAIKELADDISSIRIGGRFGHCHTGGGTNCVVDGDTFWIDGEKVRMADIDAPETHPSRCAEEDRLGTAATRRLQALLNDGPVELRSIDRDYDRYGRRLAIVTRGGRSLGDVLVEEHLARPYGNGRRSWCDV